MSLKSLSNPCETLVEDWVVIGEITKPFGLKGGFKIQPLTFDKDRFSKLTMLVLTTPRGEWKNVTLSDLRVDPNSVVLFCKELIKVEQVKPFIGGTVRIPPSEMIELPEDSYFQHDLLDQKVFLEDGRYLGEIKEIWATGSNDIFVVRDGERECLIPALKSFVSRVDITRKRITVRWIEGMLES